MRRKMPLLSCFCEVNIFIFESCQKNFFDGFWNERTRYFQGFQKTGHSEKSQDSLITKGVFEV